MFSFQGDMDMLGPFGGYVNHFTEKQSILEQIISGKDDKDLSYGDSYSLDEIREMETTLYEQYGIQKDLSFLLW